MAKIKANDRIPVRYNLERRRDGLTRALYLARWTILGYFRAIHMVLALRNRHESDLFEQMRDL